MMHHDKAAGRQDGNGRTATGRTTTGRMAQGGLTRRSKFSCRMDRRGGTGRSPGGELGGVFMALARRAAGLEQNLEKKNVVYLKLGIRPDNKLEPG